MKILVIDDLGYQTQLLQRKLSQAGHHLYSTCSPVKALEWMMTTHSPVDVVVCDLMMPEMDGIQLKEAYQQGQSKLEDSPFKHTKQPQFILVSATSDKKEYERAFSAGFMDVLSKPFEFKALLNTLDKVGKYE